MIIPVAIKINNVKDNLIFETFVQRKKIAQIRVFMRFFLKIGSNWLKTICRKKFFF